MTSEIGLDQCTISTFAKLIFVAIGKNSGQSIMGWIDRGGNWAISQFLSHLVLVSKSLTRNFGLDQCTISTFAKLIFVAIGTNGGGISLANHQMGLIVEATGKLVSFCLY